ncbi:mechanosensitive ion channel [Flammeovirga yaeyamensis]|uniref:Mechanosensitive ion channel n=1 Tax=Flammeovirga yaeyamensis TaxID=367791 RepID=A0AAX1MZQ7_9BACT|nr:mechanosensitive ion channel family protein [Flammeovirga yaeyamensis]MBB3700327.1 small-conductance mechanosensitive channel [Flammeovirga yaeyamensis]NMF37047.1 mechanosensitive ion channel family protein [Flammeovirga yaeyamensis]QWG00739.1 mechanosensitive ion channel [Flammeovirga yaeyamensis]
MRTYITILFLLSTIPLLAQNSKTETQVYKEIQSLIVADSVYRNYLRTQIDRLDSLVKGDQKALPKNFDKGVPVIPFNDTIFYVHSKGHMSAFKRAHAIADTIRNITEHSLFALDTVELSEFEDHYQLVFDGRVIHSIDSLDALKMGTSREKLAKTRQQKINKTVHDKIYGQGKKAGIYALVGLIVLVFLIKLINRIYRFSLTKVVQKNWFKNIWVKNVRILTEENQLRFLRYIMLFIRFSIILSLIYLYLPIVGQFSPPLQDISDKLLGYVIDPIKDIFRSAFAFLPNLLKIFIIIGFFHYLIELIKIFAEAIRTERLKVPGFYPDWVQPTMKIIRFVLYTFMVIMIFPLLPGAESNEFKGISVFVGVLLSIGSTSVITNAISGIVITYMRRFKIGDWIKVGDVMGEVVERSMFVTRLRSPKNEIITLPNSKISDSQTINYSQPINRYKLIIHTTVTIGYDVPWRKVHEMLKESAEMTDGLIAGEIPFVLQTSLDDYYVSYQLNAYTKQPEKLGRIYSRLHQNIQDVFSREGVEIMSPHYRANREDNEITTPPFELMKDEEKPKSVQQPQKDDKEDDEPGINDAASEQPPEPEK